MDSIKFVRVPPKRKETSSGTKLIRISSEIWYEIDRIANETRLSRSVIANQLCTYALEHSEIVDEQDVNKLNS